MFHNTYITPTQTPTKKRIPTISPQQKKIDAFLYINFHITGTLNDKAYVLHQPQDEDSTSNLPDKQQLSQHPMHRLIASVLCSPGKLVSFSLLLKNGLFKRYNINDCTKKSLMIKTAEEIALLEVGDVKTYKIQGNNTKVF